MPVMSIFKTDNYPDNCFSCYQNDREGGVCCNDRKIRTDIVDEDGEFIYEVERHPDCPLREVPEWTGEDAEVVKNFLATQKRWYETVIQITENPECPMAKATEQAIKTMEKLCQLAGVEVEI